jgi:hypothetical protein
MCVSYACSYRVLEAEIHSFAAWIFPAQSWRPVLESHNVFGFQTQFSASKPSALQ